MELDRQWGIGWGRVREERTCAKALRQGAIKGRPWDWSADREGRGRARAKSCRAKDFEFDLQSTGELLNGILGKGVTQSNLHFKKCYAG